jgi:hypothetical protein
MIDERQRARQPRLCYLETAVALSQTLTEDIGSGPVEHVRA